MTQGQLAERLNISAQAVSKWERGECLPDVQTLPLIANCFDVSIDYLYFGEYISHGDICEEVFRRVKAYPQMSHESYEEALRLFGNAHHGISHGNLRSRDNAIYDEPAHISDENGLSLLSGKGYGAVVTRKFFRCIDGGTLDFAANLLSALADRDCLAVCAAIISMSGISLAELAEKTELSPEALRSAVDVLKESGIVIEEKSKHKALGYTYKIGEMYHTCLCILLATIEMQRFSLAGGICCCMGAGDYPINM